MQNPTRLPGWPDSSEGTGRIAPGDHASIIDCYQNPLFVIDESGNLTYCNRVAAAVVRAKAGFIVKNGKLQLGSRPADAALQRIVSSAASLGDMPGDCHGMRFSRLNGSRDWFVLVRRLGGGAGNESAPRLFLLHAVARIKPRSLPAHVLQDLFGLTKRETAVVAELLRSGTVRSAARRLSLSTETVRSHLKKTFQKCDVHSQGELLVLLHGVAAFACG